ncbi:MAG TPA: CsbD family protein [Jatrophihabitans sp.]|nr:CsbD family protein [Jatrophihabitans sp.]
MGAVDKAKDKAEELGGEAKEKAGQATGDRSLETEGKVDQVSGNLKQAGEKVKDAFKD